MVQGQVNTQEAMSSHAEVEAARQSGKPHGRAGSRTAEVEAARQSALEHFQWIDGQADT